ncbi:MBL fold metallo-hydrolase [Denitratimonas tolerans]|uniref:MBL fold metallo-hydrolase n=1 Tax=Denitratimonas tolerans TaxID=1338420 RepID=A0AAW9R3H0_9GAMM
MSDRFGIHTIDTGFHRPAFDAAYLIVENGRGAFLDCGTSHSVPVLLAAVEEAGLRPADIDWLILTHVHLDHAGGAGALLRHLANARVVVHPRGAPHMIDPARLIAGATAVYGEEEMARSYGTIVPIPESRVDIARDGHRVDLAGRTLACLDTPGHALHHLCLWDATSRSVFTGDTFGISYRELDTDRGIFLFPTTTPVQFDPEALKTSIARLVALEPERAFLTHFGAIDHIPQNARSLIEQVDAMSRGALALIDAPDRHAALVAMLDALYVPRAVAHSGLAESAVRDLLGMDIELNAQGLGVWLDRRRRV